MYSRTGTGNGYRLHRGHSRVYTLAHLSLRKLLTRVPNVNERVRSRGNLCSNVYTHVLHAHTRANLRHGALLREKATGLAAASSLSLERGDSGRLPSKRLDWMTLNFRSFAR